MNLPQIACVDVDYRPQGAIAGGLWFAGWDAASATFQAVASFANVAEYEPGAFYKRELPCLLEVLSRGPRPDIIVVDGYVWLDAGKAGLGAHLHEALGIPVVGVAKTQYFSATDAIAVCRGVSRSPLNVSAAGMTADEAAQCVRNMHGEYRVPTLLKQVDTLARSSPLI